MKESLIYADKLKENLYKISSPERYTGNEWNQINKEWFPDRLKIGLAFPDVYEISMSHLGLKILYHLLNKQNNLLAERVYAPWTDMEKMMRENNIPLFSLESKHEIKDFDVFGFTLQYEMSYTTILNMLDLAGLPLRSKDRGEEYPLVIAGGATVFNPEPLTPFIDLFFIGEAETGISELMERYREYRLHGLPRDQILRNLSKIPGVYVPRFYDVQYDEAGILKEIKPNLDGIKTKIKRQVVKNLNEAFYPTDFLVPYRDIVHDRVVIEIARGCTRSCRFCAAGMVYRPVRERSKEKIIEIADQALASTGYDEISISSLSTVDYTQIEDLTSEMADRYQADKVSISLSSLRVDQFSVDLAKEVQKVRKTGLTFAPEAGTQRLRDVINKGVNEKDMLAAARSAFENGWSRLKLYFMIGLPTETEEDLQGIVDLVYRVLDLGKEIRKNTKKNMKRIQISVGVSTFVPKPFTPFQWVKMANKSEIETKQQFLRDNLKGRGIKFSWNDPQLSLLEGLLARGDRRLAPLLETVWKKGSNLEGWGEHSNPDIWFEALEEHNISIDSYLRERDLAEVLPWEQFDVGVDRKFLAKEYRKSMSGELTVDCRFDDCTGCAICGNFEIDLELVGADKNVIQD